MKLSDSQIIARVANDKLRPEVPVYCPWSELMQRCWHEKASSRPSFKYIVDTLHHIYNQERTEIATLTPYNLQRLDSSGSGSGEAPDHRRRNFHYSSDSSDESRAIGDSF